MEGITGVKSDLGHFVVNNGVAGLVAAVIIGNSGNIAIESLIDNIVMPLINTLTGYHQDDWDKEETIIGGVRYKFRKFAADTMAFFFTVIITFLFLQYFALPLIAGSKIN